MRSFTFRRSGQAVFPNEQYGNSLIDPLGAVKDDTGPEHEIDTGREAPESRHQIHSCTIAHEAALLVLSGPSPKYRIHSALYQNSPQQCEKHHCKPTEQEHAIEHKSMFLDELPQVGNLVFSPAHPG